MGLLFTVINSTTYHTRVLDWTGELFEPLQSGKLNRNNTCNIELKKTVHDLKGQLDIGLDNEQPCQGGESLERVVRNNLQGLQALASFHIEWLTLLVICPALCKIRDL